MSSFLNHVSHTNNDAVRNWALILALCAIAAMLFVPGGAMMRPPIARAQCSTCPDFCSTGGCGGYTEMGGTDYCRYSSGCPSGQTAIGTCCCDPYPILIDVDKSGFKLTNVQNGVKFDIGDDGKLDNVSWIALGSTNAWLVWDRNNNGVIDNGRELFGTATPQDPPAPGQPRNGFAALAVLDKPGHGGNGDGMINQADRHFADLRLWQDLDHNGVSTASELHQMSKFGITGLSLNYQESRRLDDYGNQFRYRGRVARDPHSTPKASPHVWDVVLVVQKLVW